MAKPKPPTPQEIYRQRRQREERERTAYLPPGFINHGNTCFMNSVLQGLIATRLLADLVLFNPIPQEIQRTAMTPIVSARSPQLTNGHVFAGEHKQVRVNTMPIGDAFLGTVCRAWAAQSGRRRESLSPKQVLSTLGQKYDQYLDFVQQDAHEFLRILLDAMRMEEFDIIKKRQPPPSPKKRRPTTLTQSNSVASGLSPQIESADPPAQPPDGELPLISFTDMIFGGQLTSILVCQKCKHVSQTYEDFADISLSIKPEDYFPHRKRDRFKKMVGKLTAFPGTYGHSKEASSEKDKVIRQPQPTHLPVVPIHTIEMLRSSSVPPSPHTEREFNVPGGGHEEPPLPAHRRRSLDSLVVVPVAGDEVKEELPGGGAVDLKDKEEEAAVESDSSHVLVNVTGPDDKHVEFVEPTKDKDDKSKEKEREKEKDKDKIAKPEDGWTKLSRRISLNIGLGKPKDKKDKERERKSRSMDRSSLAPPKEGIATDSSTSSSITQKPRATSDTHPPTHSSTHKTPTTLPPPIAPSASLPPPTRPPARPPSPQPPASTLQQPPIPNVQRSKSPKPPKPSAAETEYLRKILADVSTASSSNHFTIFKPPLINTGSNQTIPTSDSAGGIAERAGAVWLGMGSRSFTGIEECLRMFTAVEVLDGENMVGCRRCWKIQNGVLHPKKPQEPEDSDQEEDEGSSTVPSAIATAGDLSVQVSNVELKHPQPRSPIKVTANNVQIPSSMSTPVVSLFNSSSNHSNSTFPTSASDVISRPKEADDRTDSPVSLTGSESIQSGPGGLPIPVISTTGPNDLSEPNSDGETPYLSFSDGSGSRSDTNRDEAYAKLTGTSTTSISRSDSFGSTPAVPSAHPRLAAVSLGGNNSSASGSRDSLVIPPRSRYQRRKTTSSSTTTDNESSDDESDTSIGTSLSADSGASSAASTNPLAQQNSQGTIGRSNSGVNGIAASSSSQPSTSTSNPNGPPPPIPLNTKPTQSAPSKKPSKPKPVIMRPAYKRYLISTPPPVLVIHLKRFQQISKTPLMSMSFSHGLKKLDDYVSFPEYLDLMPFLAPRKEDYGLGKKGKGKRGSTTGAGEKAVNGKDKDGKVTSADGRCMYRLYAVVVHIGNMLGGHYISYTALPTDPPVPLSMVTPTTGTPNSTTSTATATPGAAVNGSSTTPSAKEKERAKEVESDPMTSASETSALPSGSQAQAQTQTHTQFKSAAPADQSRHQPPQRQWAYISDTVVRLTTLEEVMHAKAYICMYERC